MKPPDRSTNDPAVQSWDYTPRQWAEIKKILARVGVNADTATVTTIDSLRDALSKLREKSLDKLREKSLESDARHAAFDAALPGLRDETLRERLVYTARAAVALHGITPTPKQNFGKYHDALRAALSIVETAQKDLKREGLRAPMPYEADIALRRDIEAVEILFRRADAAHHGVTPAVVFRHMSSRCGSS